MLFRSNAISGMLGIAGGAGISLDSLGSLLNLNGGIASIVSAITSQFGINLPTMNNQVPTVTGTQANQPQAEPDATSEIDSWV